MIHKRKKCVRKPRNHIRKFKKHIRKSEKHIRKSEKHIKKSEKHIRKLEKHIRKLKKHIRKLKKHIRKFKKHIRKSEKHIGKIGKAYKKIKKAYRKIRKTYRKIRKVYYITIIFIKLEALQISSPMCNAYNHPHGCTCGWGGEEHLRGGIDQASNPNNDYFKKTEYSSYVNPNAKCPECGASVYFYKSESGGRVFFDELGPPWPKHPCTDINYYKVEITKNLTVGKRDWQKDDWIPVILKQNVTKSLSSFIITRLDNNKEIVVMCYGPEAENCCKEDVLNQVKQFDDCILKLNSFSISMNKELIFEIKCESTQLKKFFEFNSSKKLV